jgi:hypothetical protein
MDRLSDLAPVRAILDHLRLWSIALRFVVCASVTCPSRPSKTLYLCLAKATVSKWKSRKNPRSPALRSPAHPLRGYP